MGKLGRECHPCGVLGASCKGELRPCSNHSSLELAARLAVVRGVAAECLKSCLQSLRSAARFEWTHLELAPAGRVGAIKTIKPSVRVSSSSQRSTASAFADSLG